ncbi:LPS-assembly protein LptD [Rudanella paleaurantiibacter]|uniref:LPS-assembly protein LptD n=1 Tax=Rudanella paleaurantiibacter TaxID=2614655 RepID=A0A7J5TY74_9BACT|nr:putative LPS assembly protein LptD [Rudanella paleaurantiibacter]KAB7729383.1 LPS-assembly protein LptD [Rudanella paleaurantiibacter]
MPDRPTPAGINSLPVSTPASATPTSGTAVRSRRSLNLRTRTGAPGDTTGLAAVRDSTLQDSLAADQAFRTTVKYSSKDSTIYAADGQVVELFGDANVEYGDISLKADYIRLNYTTNEVFARGRYDSTARKLIGQPVFKDGGDQYDAKEIRYNFRSKKGKIQGVVTQQGEGNIRGNSVKKDAENNMYIRGAIYTTCNLATPHFHINASKLKVVHNKQVIAGPFNLVINQIPLPIGLPFGFFPFPKKKDIGVSGVLIPQYGEEPNGRGYYLRDGGYYWAVNENIGLQFKGQIYSRGSWGVGTTGAYNKRYRYSGGFDLRFARNRSGDRVDKTQSPRNDFAVTWSHTPQNLGKRSTFSANVNISSNSFNQFNTADAQRYVSNVAGSSVQYSRQVGQYIRTSSSFRVNQQFGQTDPRTGIRQNGKTDVATDVSFGLNQIAPFALKGGSGKWYESFRVGFDFNGAATVTNSVNTNRIDTSGLGFRIVGTGARLRPRGDIVRDSLARADSIRLGLIRQNGALISDPNLVAFNLANMPALLRNALVTGRYSIPISLPNIKLAKYINLTPGFSFNGDLYRKKLNYTYLGGDSVRIDTLQGLSTVYNFATSVSMNTRAYGTVFFKGKRLQAIRHTIAPSVSLAYVPNFSDPSFGFTQYLPIPGLPEYRRYVSRYRGIGGASSGGTGKANAIVSFGIVNQLEMKVRARNDSAGQEFKKISIFDNISLNGSYDLNAPVFNLSNISLSANTQIFKNISFNFAANFDPYAYREINKTTTGARQFERIPVYAVRQGQGLARLTSAQVYVSGRIVPKGADKPKKPVPGTNDVTMRAINANPDLYVDFNIPWSLNVSYSFGYTQIDPSQSNIIQAVTLNGDFSLTPKWKFTVQSGFDIKAKRPSLTTVGINRDLHCWDMAFNWTPFSGSALRSGNYSFDLRVRSAILQELKLSRRRSFYDRGGF